MFRREQIAPRSDGGKSGSSKSKSGRQVLVGPMGPSPQGRMVVLEDIETEAERQLKELAKKQLRTDVTLQQHLDNKKVFASSSSYKSVSDQLSGTRSLDQFRSIQELDDRIQELLQCGLTPEEVKVKLQQEEGEPSHKRSKIYKDQTAIQSQLDIIDQKIRTKEEELKKPTTFAAVKTLSRHEQDLERAISRDRGTSQTLGTLVSGKKTEQTDHKYPHPKHPMNKIGIILKDVASEEEEEEEGEFIGPMKKPDGYKSTPVDTGSMIGPWEPVDNIRSRIEVVKRVKGCAPKEKAAKTDLKGKPFCVAMSLGETNFGTTDDTSISTSSSSSSSELKVLDSKIKPITVEDILKNKLSIDQIRDIPRFKNYEEGHPSKILYVKNLPNQTTEEELASLFIQSQPSEGSALVFRLLTGRMKGQAFVTFGDTESATAALKLVNGYLLKNKPVIIQYGRQENQT